MNTLNKTQILTRTIGASAIAAALALSASASAQGPGNGDFVGNIYSPTGANYSIQSLQGINSSNPLGTADNSQVALNFEDNPSIGVGYDINGKLTDFGIGLYQTPGPGGGGPNATSQSTGLLLSYNTLVSASSTNLQLEDFDLNNNATAFNKDKVEADVLVYGANNQLIASANPTQVFGAMTSQGNLGNPKVDVWNLNVGTLLSNMNVNASGGVSKVLLYADSSNNENKNSDPYELRAVGNSQPVPEPASLCMLGMGGLLLFRKRAKARKNA